MALPSSIVLLEGRPYFFSLKKNLAIFFLFRGILVPVFLHGTVYIYIYIYTRNKSKYVLMLVVDVVVCSVCCVAFYRSAHCIIELCGATRYL
jgi:hypothetical protein